MSSQHRSQDRFERSHLVCMIVHYLTSFNEMFPQASSTFFLKSGLEKEKNEGSKGCRQVYFSLKVWSDEHDNIRAIYGKRDTSAARVACGFSSRTG